MQKEGHDRHCSKHAVPTTPTHFYDSLSHYFHAFIHPRWLAGFLNHQRCLPIIQMFKPWNFKVSGSTMKGEGLLEIVSSVTQWSWLKNWYRNGSPTHAKKRHIATQWKYIFFFLLLWFKFISCLITCLACICCQNEFCISSPLSSECLDI